MTGGCLCRAVRYSVTAEPIACRVCWCRDCQYFAAGSATVNVVFLTSAISMSGPLRDYTSIAVTESAPPWACINATMPRTPRQPPPAG